MSDAKKKFEEIVSIIRYEGKEIHRLLLPRINLLCLYEKLKLFRYFSL